MKLVLRLLTPELLVQVLYTASRSIYKQLCGFKIWFLWIFKILRKSNFFEDNFLQFHCDHVGPIGSAVYTITG